MSLESQAQRFIDTLKELDGSAGNGSLRAELGWAEGTYQRVKAHLIEEGRVVPGRGRGGSVALVKLQKKPALPKQAKPAATAPKAKRVLESNGGSGFERAFKNIDDILFKDAGCGSELDYAEQSSWLLFLKYLDALERDRAMEAELEGRAYEWLLQKKFRWESWAAPKGRDGKLDHHKVLTGPDLVEFVDRELFPYLQGFKVKASGPQTLEYKIGEIFGELTNKIRSGYNLRDVIERVDELRVGTSAEKHELSHLYEVKIRNMGNAGRNGGEYYTPRPLIRAMIQVLDPKIGETIYDGACGSAGFLCEAHDQLWRQQRQPQRQF